MHFHLACVRHYKFDDIFNIKKKNLSHIHHTVSTFTKGEQMVPVLNNVGTMCAVFGNHDFGTLYNFRISLPI